MMKKPTDNFKTNSRSLEKIDIISIDKVFKQMHETFKLLMWPSIKRVISQSPKENSIPKKYLHNDALFSIKNKSVSPSKQIEEKGPSSVKTLGLLSKLRAIVMDIGKRFKMSSPAGAPSRPMRYPYTYTAKIAQFPLKYYIKNNWMWKYYFLAVGVSFPIFWKLGRMSNSPENVKKWEEIRRRDFSGHHEH